MADVAEVAAVEAQADNIFEQAVKFVEDAALGLPATIKYKPPTEKVSEQVDVFGRKFTLTEEYDSDGNIVISEVPVA